MRPLYTLPPRVPLKQTVKVKNVGDGDYDAQEDFPDIVTAAIPLSVYKQWGGQKEFNRAMYQKIFKRFTGSPNKHRIYLPVNHAVNRQLPIVIPAKLEGYVRGKGYIVEDYRAGMAVDLKTGKRRIKIGKLVSDNPEIKALFDNDPQRATVTKSELFVVISRHPYDIGGMSYGRGWKSCLHITTGENKHYVIHDVKHGTLVAYLISSNDKNINRPLARCRILRFDLKKEDGNIDPNQFLLAREPEVYGTGSRAFTHTLDVWINTVNELFGGVTSGVYCSNPAVYKDEINHKFTFATSAKEAIELVTEHKFSPGEIKLSHKVSADELIATHNETGYELAAHLPAITSQQAEHLASLTDSFKVKRILAERRLLTSEFVKKEFDKYFVNAKQSVRDIGTRNYLRSLAKTAPFSPEDVTNEVKRWLPFSENLVVDGFADNVGVTDELLVEMIKAGSSDVRDSLIRKLHQIPTSLLDWAIRKHIEDENADSLDMMQEIVRSDGISLAQVNRVLEEVPIDGLARALLSHDNATPDMARRIIDKINNYSDIGNVLTRSGSGFGERLRELIDFNQLIDKIKALKGFASLSHSLIHFYRDYWTEDQVKTLIDKVSPEEYATRFLPYLSTDLQSKFASEIYATTTDGGKERILRHFDLPVDFLESAANSDNFSLLAAAADNPKATEKLLLAALEKAFTALKGNWEGKNQAWEVIENALTSVGTTEKVLLRALEEEDIFTQVAEFISNRGAFSKAPSPNNPVTNKVLTRVLKNDYAARKYFSYSRQTPEFYRKWILNKKLSPKLKLTLMNNPRVKHNTALLSLFLNDADPSVVEMAKKRIAFLTEENEDDLL